MFLIAHASTTKEKNGTTLNDNNLFSTKLVFIQSIREYISWRYSCCNIAWTGESRHETPVENQVDVNCLKDPHFWQRNIFLDIRKRTNSDVPKDILLRTGMDHNLKYQHHEQPQEH